MIKRLLVLVMAVAFLAGCESMGPKSKTGAVAGGVIGHQMGSGIAGAAIGATVGAISGGLIGNEIDKADQKAAAANPSYLPITSIIDMAAKGTPDDMIIEDIKKTNSKYELTTEMIDHLKKNKVSDKVIDYMLSTAKN